MSLALFISALILVSFAYSVHAVYTQMETIGERVDYEVVMLTRNEPMYYQLNETLEPHDIGVLALEEASDLKQSVKELLSDERVENAYGLLYAHPMPGPLTPENASDYLLGGVGGVLFVASNEYSGTCMNPMPDSGSGYWRILEVAAAEIGVSSACGEDVIELVDDYVSRLGYITVSTVTPTPFGGAETTVTRPTKIPPDADFVFIITSDEEVFMRAVEVLVKDFNASGVALSPAAIAVSLKPEAYVNPASAQATLERLHRIADELGGKVGASVVSTHRADEVISGYQMFESIARLAIVFGLVPPVLIVLIAANPIAESIILSMRKQVGLLRLRGADPGMLRKDFAVTTALTGVVGFLAGAGVTYAVVAAVFGPSGLSIAEVTLTDPVILAIAAFFTGAVLAYTSRKARKVIAELSPIDAVKTTLTPEELLKPLRVGGLGWFSLIAGLYFVITGYLGWSATTAMMSYMMGASGQPNIGLLIVLVVLAMVEGVLKPFAPILLAYGIAKYVAVNYDKFMERVAGSGVLGELTFVGKGLIGVMRRRVTAVLVLTIFTLSVLAQTYIATTANETLIDSAVITSLGNDYGAYLDLRMNSSTGIEGLTQYLASTGCGAYIGLQVSMRSGTGTPAAVLVIVPDPESLLANSAWYPSWSRPDPFNTALKRLSDTEVMLLSRELTMFGTKGLGVGNTTTISSWDTNASLNVTIVEESDGFPGYGLISTSPFQERVITIEPPVISNLVIAGSSMAGRLERAGFLDAGSRIRVVVTGDNNETVASCVEGIKERARELGMKPVDEGYIYVGDLEISDTLLGGSIALAQSPISITQAVILIGLAVAFSTILSWSVTKEIIRVYLLLRVRGASAVDIARIVAVKWGLLAAVAVALGLFVGGALGRGDVAASALGLTFLTLTATASGGSTMPVNLGQGVMSPYIPLEGWAIVAAAMAALILFPLVITLRIFRGAVRERFIEVR